ncbi:MAG: CinA family protein [Anaerolineales bacterium]
MTENIEQLIGNELRERGWRLAVAESCTGGLIGHRITNNSGSSTYYLGSITAYAYRAKVRLLGVSWDTLETTASCSAGSNFFPSASMIFTPFCSRNI